MATETGKANVDLDAVSHRFIETNGLRLHIAEQGSGPLILLCHGFPELWYSWRYQLPALAQAGYHVVAPDLRGYGQSEQPEDTGAYTLLHSAGDLVGLLDALGERQAILVGHDWGSSLAWQTALMRPDRFPTLITMSVPYTPRGPLQGARAAFSPTRVWRHLFKDQFFYQTYFQEPGIAEAVFERDVRSAILRFLYGASGDADPAARWHPILPDPQASSFDLIGTPSSLPPWLTEADVDYYTAEFSRTGFRGGLNWYRNMDRNWEFTAAYSAAPITQPTLFLWGEQDPLTEIAGMVRATEHMPQFVPNLRKVSLPGAGHWIQQERAQEVNAAILAFLQEQKGA